MAWTYDPSLSLPRDLVRSRVGDTDATDPQMSDEEVAAYLGGAGGAVLPAAVAICVALAAKYARQVNVAELLLPRNRTRKAAKRAAELAALVDDKDDWANKFRAYHRRLETD